MVKNGGILKMFVSSGFFHAKRTPGNWYWPFSYDFWFKGYSKFYFLGQNGQKKGEMGQNRQKSTKIWKKNEKFEKNEK